MTALTVTKRGTITLPLKLRKKWGGGEAALLRLQLSEHGDGILLRPLRSPATAGADSRPANWMAEQLDRSPMAKARRRNFIRKLNAEYTQQVCAETLRINEEYPVHDDSP